jgi:hypothetical protein
MIPSNFRFRFRTQKKRKEKKRKEKKGEKVMASVLSKPMKSFCIK